MAGLSSSLVSSFLSLARGEGWRGERAAFAEEDDDGKLISEQKRLERQREREVTRRLMSANRHSRFVSLMRYALPVAAVVLAVVLLSWPGASRVDSQALPQTSMSQREMINPHYRGVNRRGEPLEIQAARAVQSGDLESVVDLEAVRGRLVRSGGSFVDISADRGHYDQKENHLVLEGSVHIVDDAGYDLVTARAEVDLSTPAQAWGDQPVSGVGPQGRLSGNGFRITDEGKTVVVTGRAQIELPSARAVEGERGAEE